jgi:hypothetical protein
MTPLKRMMMPAALLTLLLCFTATNAYSWGFTSHRKINRMAVFLLPPEMIGFFKNHIEYLSEHAVDPDKRSRSVPGEAEKHYIDIDHFGDKPFDVVPRRWKDAVNKYSEDTLRKWGINPWWIDKMMMQLTQAFRDEDFDRILWTAANFGHYVADATVPLHTTQWYDGRIPEQKGIHAFWETRVPELFINDYNYFIGKAVYIESPLDYAWELVQLSHSQVDTIMMIEEDMRKNYPDDKKYVFEERGAMMMKQFSKSYTQEFSRRMNGMVERNLRRAILAVASLWFTAWVNAGQPDLSRLDSREISAQHKKDLDDLDKMWKTGKPVGRPNPEDETEQ